MKKLFRILFYLSFSLYFAMSVFSSPKDNSYLWPTNASHILNSTFGEYRPGHFHSGIDIKTWEKEGFRVFAVRSGYIARIRVSPFGYGKALYLKLDTGEFAVYGHLQRFASNIERYVKRIQKKRQHYSVDLSVPKNKFPVHRGDIIAYTGRTGIGAPHLHFEIRDAQNRPLNPLLKHFHLNDRIRPTLTRFGIIPFDRFSQVEGEPLPKIFTAFHHKGGHYWLDHPVQVWGTLGLAISAYDRTAFIPNRCSVYQISLKIDGQPIFSTRYDRFSFGQTHQIVFDRNYRFIAWHHQYFNNLFLLPANTLPFYTPSRIGAGMLETSPILPANLSVFSSSLNRDSPSRQNFWAISQLSPGKHTFRIDVFDFFRNHAWLTGTLIATPKKPTLVTIQQRDQRIQVNSVFDDSLLITLSRDGGKTWQPFSGKGRNSNHNVFLELPILTANRSILLKIQALDSLGVRQFPEYYRPFPTPIDRPQPAKVEQTYFLDDYVVYVITSSAPVTVPLFLRYTTRHKTGRSRLLPLSPTRFEATLPLDSIADAQTLVFVDFSGKRAQFPLDTLSVTKINPSKGGHLSLFPDGTQIQFLQNAAYQPIFFRYSRESFSTVSAPIASDSITYVLNLQPTDIPLRRGAILSFHVPETQHIPQKLAIYALGKTGWHFQNNSFDPMSRTIQATLKSFGQFTLLQDTIPPEITRIFPRPGRRIRSNRPIIRAYFRDNLSGIKDEESVKIYLDGIFRISEYDPEMNRVTFVPDKPLHVGKHIAKVEISDRCGNSSRKIWYFYIQKARK